MKAKRSKQSKSRSLGERFKQVGLPKDIKTFHDILQYLYWLRWSAAMRDRPSMKDIKRLTELTPKVKVHLERFQIEVAVSSMGAATRHDVFTLFEFTDTVERQVAALRQTLPLI